jgi:predicted nucleic acid-binding Zn ribbon protein
MDSLTEILKLLKNRYPTFSKRIVESEALGRWEVAVGPTIAKHTRVIKVQDAVLWVEVDHPIWKSELHYRKEQILKILNEGSAPSQLGPAEKPLNDLFFVDPRKTRT